MIYISCFLMQAYNGHDEALGVLVNYVDNVDVLDDKGKILFLLFMKEKCEHSVIRLGHE